MDESEHFPLSRVPVQALSLRLSRSTIKMQHSSRWKIDKLNPVHDLVICLTGGARYEIMQHQIELAPGDAMLIPAYTRFRGAHAGGEDAYTGIAQHFSLELFGRGDVIAQMQLEPKVRLTNWSALEPLVTHYRESSSTTATTLPQHHQFMVLLLEYLQDAFVDWKSSSDKPESQDQLSLHIMLVASRLSADPLGSGVEEALANIPYNPDYFRRAFRDRMGMTPQKFRELKRMEFAVNRLAMGVSVKEVAAELGYSDPYFFSRMFKRHIGASPSNFRLKKSERDAAEDAL